MHKFTHHALDVTASTTVVASFGGDVSLVVGLLAGGWYVLQIVLTVYDRCPRVQAFVKRWFFPKE